MSAPFLSLSGVRKRFGSIEALAGVDLELGAGEILAVLGPTGAGKTTLLRAIAGLEQPDAGSIRMDGADLTARAPAERDVALVFQNFSLYPRMSVRENLAFPLRAPGRRRAAGGAGDLRAARGAGDLRAARGAGDLRAARGAGDLRAARGAGESGGAAEIDARVREAAALLSIERLLDRPAGRLSGGEMQRVAIGRAIVRRPRLFLMDEPLANLDAKLREHLRVELAELVRRLGTPMIYVTHDQAEALSMADRLAVLIAGRVLQVGEPRQVYLQPASPAIARQLGSPPINLLRVRCERASWRAADGTALLPAGGAAEGSRALLGIRPEHVLPEGGDAPARVEVVQHAGARRVVLARWLGEAVHLSMGAGAPWTTGTTGRELAPGDVLRPRLDAERALVWLEA